MDVNLYRKCTKDVYSSWHWFITQFYYDFGLKRKVVLKLNKLQPIADFKSYNKACVMSKALVLTLLLFLNAVFWQCTVN